MKIIKLDIFECFEEGWCKEWTLHIENDFYAISRKKDIGPCFWAENGERMYHDYEENL